MVWPSARGVLRRTIELLLSVILSKLVVCIAISVGVAALAGAGSTGANGTGAGSQVAASMGTLFVGTAILVVAAFAPFLILKLIPWTEAALVAHGMSRSPVRAANTTVMSANSASSIARLAGGGGKSAPALPAGGGGNGWGCRRTAPRLGRRRFGGRSGGRTRGSPRPQVERWLRSAGMKARGPLDRRFERHHRNGRHGDLSFDSRIYERRLPASGEELAIKATDGRTSD